MQLKTINSLEEMASFSAFFLGGLKAEGDKAVVVGLSGDLGSGKTTFVQCIANVLKIGNYITSPTFIIQKRYPINSEKFNFKNLIHIDAYRLENGQDLLNLGWEEIKNNPENLIFIEWPEKVSNILSADIKKIYFKFINEGVREISYEKSEE